MFYTYILLSKKDGRLYTGATDDLRKRFSLHQNGEVVSIKGRGPFKLIYYEACLNRQDAFMREKFLKSGPGKKYLKNRLKRFLSLTGQVKGARPVRVRTQNVSVNSNRGYIALITVVVVMAVLLIIGSVVAGAGYFGRFSQLEYESKGVSLGLAEACVNAAFLDIAKDPSINNSAYDKCVSVGDNCLSSIRKKVCKICSITNVGSSNL